MIHGGKRRDVCHGTSHCGAGGIYERGGSPAGAAGEGCGPGALFAGYCRSAGRIIARGGGTGWRNGPANAAGLGDPVQRGGPEGLINIPSAGAPAKLKAEQTAFLARIVEEGPNPAVHGVVHWGACDLILRLEEAFGLSVPDDTIYRALHQLGFSHLSARLRAYKQDPEAMEAFKKISPRALPTSTEAWHRTRRSRSGSKTRCGSARRTS